MRHEVNLLLEHSRQLAELCGVGRELTRQLSGTRFSATSDGGLVSADVDHTARVLAIRIAPSAPTRSRASDLAAQTVQAVTAECRRRLATLGGLPGQVRR